MQGDLVSGALGNVQAVVHGVGSARRNQVDVNDGTRGPGIAFVDGIPVLVNLKRAIEVGAGFDRAFAVVLDHAAPENCLSFVVGGLELEPGVVGVHGATREKMADLLCAHYNINTHGVPAAKHRLHAIERRGNRRGFGCRGSNFGFGLFANRKSRLNIGLRRSDCLGLHGFWRDRKNIDAQNAVLEEFFRQIELIIIFVCGRDSGIRTGKTM